MQEERIKEIIYKSIEGACKVTTYNDCIKQTGNDACLKCEVDNVFEELIKEDLLRDTATALLDDSGWHCSKCKKVVLSTDNYCHCCGSKLKEKGNDR